MDSTNPQITTDSGHVVIFRPYITGRAERHIADSFKEDLVINGVAGSKDATFSMNALKSNIAQDRTIEACVISVDGITENVVSLVLDLPAFDFNEVIREVERISGDADKKKGVSVAKT